MQAFGLTWALEPGLGIAVENTADPTLLPQTFWTFRLAESTCEVPGELCWDNGNEASEPVFLLARTTDAAWLRFPRECDFRIEFDRRTVLCFPVAELPRETLAHLIFNQVMPRIAAQVGKVVLHASAVHLSGTTIAFTGPSGAGKSSLAAKLCESGASLMADDGLVIENEAGVLAIPAYPGLRLRHGTPLPRSSGGTGAATPSFRNKFIFNGEHLPFRFHDEPTPLKALFLLADGTTGELKIERLSARGAFETIASNCFRLDAGDRGRMVKEFAQITSLVDRLPVYRLGYPRTWSVMPAVIDRIKQVLHGPDLDANDRGSIKR